MAAKQLAFDENARNQIKGGVDALADAVKVTLGPKEGMSFSTRSLAHRQSPKMV